MTAATTPDWLRRAVRLLAFPLAMVLIGLVASGNRFFVYLATSAAIVYIVTTAFNLIFGYAGLFTLGHIALYGIGAYACVIIQERLGVPFWVGLLVGVALGALFGFLLALPTMRHGHIFLAVATLAFGTAVEEVAIKWTDVTGGADGFRGIQPPSFFGFDLVGGSLGYYVLAAIGAIIAFELSVRVGSSQIGRRFIVMRESPFTLTSIGVRAANVRLMAFVLSGALAGFAGGLFAHFQLFVSAEAFGLHRIVQLFIALMIGGAGTVAGPIIGVAALVGIDELGARLHDASEVLYGVVMILLLNYARGSRALSIASLIQRVRPSQERERSAVDHHVTLQEAAEDEHLIAPGVDLPDIGDLARDLAGTDQSVLTAQDVTVRFGGVTALSGVGIRCSAGEVLGLIGPNGAGKTTFVNALTGFVTPSEGTMTMDGTSLVGLRGDQIVSLGVVRTFQRTRLVPELDVLTNVMIGRDRFGQASFASRLLRGRASRAEDEAATAHALALLEPLDLLDVVHEEAGSLPYGLQRRVEIARALAVAPRFLLLDEPGAGLNAAERDEVARLIKTIAGAGVGVILIDHNVSFVASVSSSLVVLDQGRVLAEGLTEDVLARDDVSAAYLGRGAP